MIRRPLVFIAGAVVVVAVTWALFDGLADVRTDGGADANDSELVALGGQVYAQACASCHGTALEGEANWRVRKASGRLPAPPHDATGHTWHHDDWTLFGITKLGSAEYAGLNHQSDMPGFAESLDDREIWAVLAFIKSTWPADIQARQAQITHQAAGQK